MSDTTYNVFQHYGTNAERLAFVPNPAAAIKPIYIWYETDTNRVFIYTTIWNGPFVASGGAVTLHAPTHAAGGTDPVTLTQAQITNLVSDLALKADLTDPRFTDARVPLAHAPSHLNAASDPLDVKLLAGFPGGSTTFLRADATFAAIPARTGAINMVIDGGSSVIAIGFKGYIEIPFACTIQAVTLLADVAGDIVIDIWKDTYAAFPPVVGDSITAAAKPTIPATNIKSQDTTLTGWNTAIVAGDILGFNVDSVTTIKKVTLSLKILVP